VCVCDSVFVRVITPVLVHHTHTSALLSAYKKGTHINTICACLFMIAQHV